MSTRERAAGRARTRREPVSRPGAPIPTPRRADRRTAREVPPAAVPLSPMLCEVGAELPAGPGWVFEPKLDGIRVLAVASRRGSRLVTRNGNDKGAQFPELIEALDRLAAEVGRALVLDGEIVALDAAGRPLRFGALQGRMHLRDETEIERHAGRRAAALVAFDLLADGDRDLTGEPWTERRERLESRIDAEAEVVRLVEVARDGDGMMRRAAEGGWEGLIAKRAESTYRTGRRSRDWLKLKIENRQEFVVGGWTEPRRSRTHLGALLLGYYDAEGVLRYAGHTGTGFSHEALETMHRRLRRLERKTPPFAEAPTTNEPAHWVTPRVVVEVRFNEWTRDGRLRQPVFLGVRDDKDAREVVREAAGDDVGLALPETAVVRAIREMPAGGGTLELEGDGSLRLTNLDRVHFPGAGVTKRELLCYYARMAPLILPWMEGRPLVLKRYPGGIEGESFYQQTAPDPAPPGVRVEGVELDEGKGPQPRLVGGGLATLLATVQLGAVSYDPWHSRVERLESADYTIIDLDPGEGAGFDRVVMVAQWVREEMEALGLHGALKTSGSRGIHVYLPLPAGTGLEAATLIAQIVATRVAQRHPEVATVERMVRKRPPSTVYVDYLQNILGKTVAGVYAVRARPGATVSTPLRWEELDEGLDPGRFTVRTVPERVQRLGDLWAEGMARPNRLSGLLPSRRR